MKRRKEMNQKSIDELLNAVGYPSGVTADCYSTTHDDHDGDPSSGTLTICVDRFGDIHLSTVGNNFRYRTYVGGGKYPKIRNALLILAEAIRQEGGLT